MENDLINKRLYNRFGNVGEFKRKSVEGIINRIPTVDAVEVVRCKDCIKGYIPDGEHYIECFRLGILLSPNDYCSLGVRRSIRKGISTCMNNDYIYFELNNWCEGEEYPDAEPFLSWFEDDLNIPFLNKDWVCEQKLCVVESIVDMSFNYCITATWDWVGKNCPELITNVKYKKFLRYPDEDGDVFGQFGCPFLEYSEENIGYHFKGDLDEQND